MSPDKKPLAQAKKFSFKLEKTHQRARAGEMTTAHGKIKTPIFMPVGTAATVKSLDSQDILDTQAQIILANTYHLYLRPGSNRVEELGGLHKFMNWQKPMLTDSGGFQVFSLGKDNVKIGENKVEFKSFIDGSKHTFTPEKAIEIQRQLGADIIMAFDECAPDEATKKYTAQSLAKTHRWAERCFKYWQEKNQLSSQGHYQALFGIIQGSKYQDLRQESADFITGKTSDLNFDGIAVGGESIGYNMERTVEIMDWIESSLPKDKPRYAMGLGRDPQNLIDAVASGFDIFDCVGPSRLARNGALYSGELIEHKGWLKFKSPYKNGRLNISNKEFATDQSPIDSHCDCHTCQSGYTRAYLHHLYRSQELSYYRLATIHNIRLMVRLSEQIRSFISRS